MDYSTLGKRKVFYASKAWRETRAYILRRDNNECQECKRQGKVFVSEMKPDKQKTLDVDHIKSLEEYPELALVHSNLETLCIRCHNKKEGRFFQRKPNKWAHDECW